MSKFLDKVRCEKRRFCGLFSDSVESGVFGVKVENPVNRALFLIFVFAFFSHTREAQHGRVDDV
jgi:hypothetical protein